MHEHVAFLLSALLILVYGLFSQLAERLPITAPMFFTLVGVAVSPLGFDLFDVHVDAALVKVLAEVTLVLVLFVDATEISVAEIRAERSRIPTRLLAIGLPGTMLLGFLAGLVLFENVDLWALALIALVLSPTDAALGQAVIKSQALPGFLKRNISIESGLNDGIALPPILVCVAALSVGSAASEHSGSWLQFLALQLTIGPLMGAVVGWVGGRLVETTSSRRWMSPTFQRLSAMSLAIVAFALAELLGGNGFIAAFCGGLFLGVTTPAIRERIQEFGEAEGQQLALFIFLIFGMIVVPIAFEHWDLRAFAYAVCSLTVVRMLPVALSLIGTGFDMRTRLFIGWFGPRGIASILYLLMVVGTLGVKGFEYPLSVIVLTVLLSVVLHGISAVPLVNRYSRTGDEAP